MFEVVVVAERHEFRIEFVCVDNCVELLFEVELKLCKLNALLLALTDVPLFVVLFVFVEFKFESKTGVFPFEFSKELPLTLGYMSFKKSFKEFLVGDQSSKL